MKNKKATGANCGSTNPFDLLTSNQRLFVFDYEENEQKLQSNLLAQIKRHNKVIRLFHCFGCERNFTTHRMSNCLAICRDCYHAAQDKGKIAKQNFIERTMNNFHKFLRRRVAV